MMVLRGGRIDRRWGGPYVARGTGRSRRARPVTAAPTVAHTWTESVCRIERRRYS